MFNEKYYIFSDESGYDGSNRYASLASISGTKTYTKELNTELQEILKRYNKKEIKFKKIKNTQTENIANEFIEASLKFINSGKVKVHILLWDKQDSRHSVQNRDDIKNMAKMYYKLIIQVRNNWSVKNKWYFFPDEFEAINWKEEIAPYIENTPIHKIKKEQPILFQCMYDNTFSEFNTVKELESDKYPLIQLADLYAGMMRTSKKEIDFYHWYNESYTNEANLFDLKPQINISKSREPKYRVMKNFKDKSSLYKMGINLSSDKCFKTFTNKGGIVIWHYSPQNKYDKAPTNNS